MYDDIPARNDNFVFRLWEETLCTMMAESLESFHIFFGSRVIVSDIFFSLLSLSLSPFRNGLCWKGRKMYFKKTRDSFPTIEIPLKFTNSSAGAANGR